MCTSRRQSRSDAPPSGSSRNSPKVRTSSAPTVTHHVGSPWQPCSPRVEEPVLARCWLAPIGAFDESDDPRAGTGMIALPRFR